MPQHAHLSAGDSVSVQAGAKLRAVDKSPYLGDYALSFANARLRAAREAYSAQPTLQVILASVEKENFVRLRSSVLAKKLGVSIPTVERHLAELRRLRIIEPDPFEADKKSGIVSWRVCPYLAWRGRTPELADYLTTLPKDHPWLAYNDEVLDAT